MDSKIIKENIIQIEGKLGQELLNIFLKMNG